MSPYEKALKFVERPSALTIRVRERRGYSREAGGYDVWTEYQVVEGRNIRWRAETPAQAENFIWVAKDRRH